MTKPTYSVFAKRHATQQGYVLILAKHTNNNIRTLAAQHNAVIPTQDQAKRLAAKINAAIQVQGGRAINKQHWTSLATTPSAAKPKAAAPKKPAATKRRVKQAKAAATPRSTATVTTTGGLLTYNGTATDAELQRGVPVSAAGLLF